MHKSIVVFFLFFLYSCTYNELILGCTDPNAFNFNPDANVEDNDLCVLDICLSEPTFEECVFPIFQQNCISCHSYGGDADFLLLSNYDLIIKADNVYGIVNSINTSMPKDGLMFQENINVIEKWFENDAPNN